MNDAKGTQVGIGDVLLDERGLVYEVIDDLYQHENVSRVVELRSRRGRWARMPNEYLTRNYFAFVVTLGDLPASQPERKRLWAALYEKHCRARGRASALARQAEADAALREAGLRP